MASWSINAATPVEAAQPVEALAPGNRVNGASRQLFDAATGAFVDANVVSRDNVNAGNSVVGPAAITEAETTVIVPTGFIATVQPDGCIEVSKSRELSS